MQEAPMSIRRVTPGLLMVVLAAGFARAADGDGFVPLFDGKTLAGWHNPFEWGQATVEDGEVRLTADKKFFLVTDKKYGDFILDAEVMLPPEGKSNSGIQVRSHEEKNRVFGTQAECDPSDRAWTGGLYDEGRRMWLWPREGEQGKTKLVKAPLGEWIKYHLECVGDHLVFSINGQQTVDYRDSLDVSGVIALQHHGEKGQTYRFRNIRIKDMGTSTWKPLFDGKSLDGWTALPGGKWGVKDGVILGTSEHTDPRHGILISNEKYKDFTIRMKYKSVAGNSGFYFRVDKSGDAVTVHGFQAEIDPAKDIGGLYETGGRAWVVQPTAEQVKKYFKPGEWNDMTVSAHGKRIVVTVNGIQTADLPDDPGRLEGYLGLQLHGGMDMHVEFKDIETLTPPAN
jgi:hypothetical protein